jgi:hypothetical protein
MATFEITSPDGRKFRVTGPEGATREDALAKVQAQYSQQPEKPEYVTGHNTVMGALKGASDIGATLLSPVDFALNKLGITDKTNKERREQLKQFFSENADPESVGFKVGEIGTQIAGTAGVGGVLAKGAQAVGAAPKIASALQSGGFSLGSPAATTVGGKAADMALRMGAGGATGAAMTGMVDPENMGTGAALGAALPPAVGVAGAVGRGIKNLATHTLGSTTGAGSEAIKQAYRAGQTGSGEFLKNMRGESQFDDVVLTAKQGLQKMRADRAAEYRSGMINIKGDKSVLDMKPIAQAVDDIKSAGFFKGKAVNEKAAGTLKEIADKVDDWATSSPKDFHTPEGLDALKKAIGDIRDSTQFGTPARRAADDVYNAIKSQITKQAPTYSKVMKDYSQASETLTEIEKALSIGSKASKDTAMRKLQSLMRNNVNTNYGNRLTLAQQLEQKGGVDLMNPVAGQALSSWTPRGLQGLATGGAAPVLALMGAPVQAAGLAAVSSPRLVGEAAYRMGGMSGGMQNTLARVTRGALPGGGQNMNALMQNPAIRNALLQANLANP